MRNPAAARRPGRRVRVPGLPASVAVVLVAAALAGCGGSVTPPATGAARVVPADALAYVHLSIDRARPSVTGAAKLVGRLPGVERLVTGLETRLGALIGAGSFREATSGWIGRELAVAVVPVAADRAGLLYVFAVRDRPAAARFVAAHPGQGGSRSELIGRYVVVGPRAALAAAAGVAKAGPAASLGGSAAYRRAAAAEPAGRVLDLYAPAAGMRELLSGRGQFARLLLSLLDRPDLQAFSAAISVTPHGGRVTVRSVLAGTPHPVAFSPSLARVLPAGAALMVDSRGLAAAAPRLLAVAAAAGIGGRLGPLISRLGAALRAEGVDTAGLDSLFSGETAVAVSSIASHPALMIVSRTADPASARLQLAALEPSVAALFPPAAGGPGQAPLFTDHTIAGADVHELQLAAGLQIDYTVIRRMIVLSTGTAAIAALADRGRSLASTADYRSVAGALPGRPSSLVFLDLSQLIRLGEQTGLLRGASFQELAPDLARIRAIGVRSAGGKNESTAELSFNIS